MPEGVEYLWLWFLELERTRQVSQAGIGALTYSEIGAWAALTDRRPRPHEVDALLALDLVARVQAMPAAPEAKK